MFSSITRYFKERKELRAEKAAEARDQLLRNSLPEKLAEYREFQFRWAEAGIYMLKQSTFEEWLFNNPLAVKAEVQKMLRDAGL